MSDRAATGVRGDAAGPVAAEMLRGALGVEPAFRDVLADDAGELEKRLVELCDEQSCDLVLTTGGTGLSPRDVTPEATRRVIDREVPGIAEAIRAAGLSVTPFAMLSRAISGARGRTLIVNLSGSPRAVREQLAVLIPVLSHALATLTGATLSCGELPRDAG